MKVLITGAAGFIGQITAKALLDDDGGYDELVLTDIVQPPVPVGAKHPERARCVKADLFSDAATVVSSVVSGGGLDAVLLLHGIMSSGAEADLALGYRVNVDATRAVLDQLIRTCPGVRVLYASSEAVYGRPVPTTRGVTEDDIPAPEMSYGCQKIICETFINDYTRRGLLNGFSLRFPTISVRPGAPSAAISSFLSGVIREPLNGQPCVIPVRDRAWRHWMSSPKTLVANIQVALQLPRDALPLHRRSVNMPGFAVTVQQMLDALEEVGGAAALALVEEVDVPEIRSTLYSWADDFDNSLALSLGMAQDTAFLTSVRDYKETLRESTS